MTITNHAKGASHSDGEIDELAHKQNEKTMEKKNYVANQYRIFSITYGVFFCLTGIVLTTIEPFKACKINSFY